MTIKEWFAQRNNVLFVVALVVWHGVFFVVILSSGNQYLKDSYEYLHVAENMVQHHVYYAGDIREPYNADNVSRRPPGYPLLLAAVHAVVRSDIALALLQIAISVSTLCGVSLLLQRRFGCTSSANVWLFIAAFLYPIQALYASLVMSETLFQALLFWCIYAAIEFYYNRRAHAMLAANVLLCAALLTKPVAFLLWVPALLCALYYAWRLRQWWLVAYGALPLLTVLGWSALVGVWTGYTHFSSMKKINLLNYNAHALISRVHGNAVADSVVDAVYAHARTINNYEQQSVYMEREAMQWIQAYPVQYALLHTQGAFNLLLDPGRYDAYTFFGLENTRSASLLRAFSSKDGYGNIVQTLVATLPVSVWLWLAAAMVGNIGLLLCAVYFVVRVRCPIGVKVILVSVVVYAVGVAGAVGVARYKTAVFPFLLCTVPLAVATWKQGRHNAANTNATQVS